MLMKRLVQIMMVAALVLAAPVQAVKRYSCDFETQAARNSWVLNPTSSQSIYDQLTNKWYIGEAGNNSKSGQYGLFISDNGGQSAHYSNNGCWVFAYDIITLDTIQNGDYTLIFDYCALANVESDFDGIYAFWIPLTDPNTGKPTKIGSIASSSRSIPSVYEDYVLALQPAAQGNRSEG